MTISALGCLTLVGTAVGGLLLNMLSKEAETWLGALPLLLLKLARARVRRSLRNELYDEWAAELFEATHQYAERPLSRLWLGMRYAGGILWAAIRIAKDIGAARDSAPANHLTISSPPMNLSAALAGAPRPASAAERVLEQALSRRVWAVGRRWNQAYQPDPLASPLRIDLWWRDEQCVVEIDGPEHRGEARYKADRQRDLRLQLDRQTVMRFTTAQVLAETDRVVSAIEQVVCGRR